MNLIFIHIPCPIDGRKEMEAVQAHMKNFMDVAGCILFTLLVQSAAPLLGIYKYIYVGPTLWGVYKWV